MSKKLLIIVLGLQLCLSGCSKLLTTSVVYKPSAYGQGYVIEVYTPFNCCVVMDDEHAYYAYVFCSNKIPGKFFISNDSSYGYDVRLSKSDTVVQCGRDTALRYHLPELTTRIQGRNWKTVYVLDPERAHNDYFDEVYGNSVVTYGYVNVRKKDKKIYDRIIESVEVLKDTTIIRDSIAIRYELKEGWSILMEYK